MLCRMSTYLRLAYVILEYEYHTFPRSILVVTASVTSLEVQRKGGVVSSRQRANSVGGNEASVWHLIGA